MFVSNVILYYKTDILLCGIRYYIFIRNVLKKLHVDQISFNGRDKSSFDNRLKNQTFVSSYYLINSSYSFTSIHIIRI